MDETAKTAPEYRKDVYDAIAEIVGRELTNDEYHKLRKILVAYVAMQTAALTAFIEEQKKKIVTLGRQLKGRR